MLSNFPDVNRYTQHNNLVENYDACMFIPYGPKCYVWFTEIEKDPTCVVVDITREKSLTNATKQNMCFNNELASGKGTVLYCVKNNQTNIIVEDILMFKGNKANGTFKEKLTLFKWFYTKDFKQDLKNQLKLSLVWIRNNINDENITDKIPYDVYSTKYCSLKTNSCRIILTKNDNTLNKSKYTFIIKKTNKCELYELYILDRENKPIHYDYALINDLHTSKKMISLFNKNNNNETLVVKCFYNKTYKGWIPDEVIMNKNIRISNVNELRKYPSNYL